MAGRAVRVCKMLMQHDLGIVLQLFFRTLSRTMPRVLQVRWLGVLYARLQELNLMLLKKRKSGDELHDSKF